VADTFVSIAGPSASKTLCPQSFPTPLRSSGLKNLEKGSIDETIIFLPGTLSIVW